MAKKIKRGDMNELRAVLQGKDGRAMWNAFDRMKISSKNKPYYIHRVGHVDRILINLVFI